MSDAPLGMLVEPRDLGFVVTLKHTLPVPGVGRLVLGTLVAAVLGFTSALVMLESAPAVAGLALLPAVVGVVITGIVMVAIRQARLQGRDRVEVDGSGLRFYAVEGPVSLPLDQIKAVEVVPVGLAIREHTGGSLHLALPKVPPESRVWLRDRIRGAVARHGHRDEVPEALKALDRGRARE